MLETHTIDEESENSQESPSNSKRKETKESVSSNYKSLPKYSDGLDKIDESPFEDGGYASQNPRTPNR